MHDKRFPNESESYRSTREELLKAETDLRAQIERVAALRRQLSTSGPVADDYVFERIAVDRSRESVRFSELFAPGKDTLAIYSFMYGPKMEEPCPMCASLIDGLDAYWRQLDERMNLAVVAQSPIDRIMEFARERWRHVPLLSSHGTSYDRDYWAEQADGSNWPMMNVFVKREGGIQHFWGSELLFVESKGQPRHLDLMWPLWNVLDLTPEGRGTDWYPRLSYD